MSIATAIPTARAQSSTPTARTVSMMATPAPAPVVRETRTTAPPKPVRLRAPRGGITLDGVFIPGGRFLPATAAPTLEDLAGRAARRSTTEPVVIGICGFGYRVEALPIDPSIGTHAFSVQDIDRNRIYTVHRSAEGEVVCDCGDFTWRKAGTGQPCKHGRELVALGLITTRPTVLPPFAQRAAVEASAPAQCEPIPAIAGTAAAVAGFERWAADRMATTLGTAEAWHRRGEQLGRAGRLVDLEVAFPDATPRQVLMHALDFGEGMHFGFRDFARQVGYAAGLDGGPADRPATIPGRFDAAFIAGHEAGSAEGRERDRLQELWQLEAQEEEQERWLREENLEARGYYQHALATAWSAGEVAGA